MNQQHQDVMTYQTLLVELSCHHAKQQSLRLVTATNHPLRHHVTDLAIVSLTQCQYRQATMFLQVHPMSQHQCCARGWIEMPKRTRNVYALLFHERLAQQLLREQQLQELRRAIYRQPSQLQDSLIHECACCGCEGQQESLPQRR